MAITPSERQRLLAELSTVAIRDLVQLWDRAKVADVDFARFLIEAFPEIAVAYSEVAGDLAADWYEQSAPTLAYQAVPAPMPNVTALTKSAQWALGGDGDIALNRLAGTLQRGIFDGARNTTLFNVETERGASWARHASANACEFCRLMATRGAAYRSEENAAGKKYHDRCHCVAVEVRPGMVYEPPAYVQDWTDQYLQARDLADSGKPKDILSAWRQILNQ